ncbi:MAG: hypothetical protein JWN72_2379, partial [Thermoleophilia bacterium]|nr:hypothetical protein [Thermoleophilia bacterium]
AAADPRLRRSVRAVLAVQPVADVPGLVRLAVTGQARGAGGVDAAHASAARVRGDVGRAIVQLVRDRSGELDDDTAGALDEVGRSDDPIAAFARLPTQYLDTDLRAIQAVLGATDPRAFDAAWKLLPADLLATTGALSPSAVADQVAARVLIVEPERDSAYPAADGARLARSLPHARVRTTDLISGTAILGTETSGAAVGDPTRAQVQALLSDVTWWLEAAND